MKATTIKFIYDFNEEVDISYITIKHNFKDKNSLLCAVTDANKACKKYNNDDEESSLYAQTGHNSTTLMDYLASSYEEIAEWDYDVSFTVTSQDCIIIEPMYDYSLEMNYY